MNNIFILISLSLVIGIAFVVLFLVIGVKVYDCFITQKARNMIENGWHCCSLCPYKACKERGNKIGDGCYRQVQEEEEHAD